MKKIVLFTLIFLCSFTRAIPWGKTGHRVIGLIAEQHLTKKAKKNIDKVLRNETLAEVSNFMDFIRSDDAYDYMSPWHYSTIPDGQTYEEAGIPEEGDAISKINQIISELETKEFTFENEAFALKCLVHLIGDLHQPLHVGNGEDRGGNDVKLDFFWSSSNLHRVWDSGIIDGIEYSYTEYTEWINHPTEAQIEAWQNDDVLDWAYESMKYRDQAYDLPENKKISYEYVYENRELVNLRLLQAGVRLAGVLNQIYG